MQAPEVKEGHQLCPRCHGAGVLEEALRAGDMPTVTPSGKRCTRCKGCGAVDQPRQRDGNSKS
jgi:DnaJ-class molecular chaperone